MLYQDFPIDEGIQRWVKMGGEPWQLIEPVDGFHTSQYAHAIFTDIYWEHILSERPNWIPPENPFNDQIIKIFGDQGGY
jgi:acyloxyacyl hydrolase